MELSRFVQYLAHRLPDLCQQINLDITGIMSVCRRTNYIFPLLFCLLFVSLDSVSRTNRQSHKHDSYSSSSSDDVLVLDQDSIIGLREQTREAFLHAYNSYIIHGWPYDEVMPISCKPRRFDHKSRGTLDDSLGG